MRICQINTKINDQKTGIIDFRLFLYGPQLLLKSDAFKAVFELL